MSNPIAIVRGKAVFSGDGLRCRGNRDKSPAGVCNKLLVKKNGLGQIAGSFRCERCKQDVEVQIAPRSA